MTHPYPKVKLSFGGDRGMDAMLTDEDTGKPVGLLKLYEMLEYYRATVEFQEKQINELYRSMAGSWPLRPAAVAAMEEAQ